MILTHDIILDYIKKGFIEITPFNESNVGAASYDLTLDNSFRVELDSQAIDAKEDVNLLKFTKVIKVGNYYELKPGELILGITKETIKLPNNIAGILEGRSTFARIGLMVHVTANLVHPGCNNKQVLEIYNASNRIIKLYPNVKICQIVFMKCLGEATYSGKYELQKEI